MERNGCTPKASFSIQTTKPVPGSEFGVNSGKVVYLDALPGGKYKLQFQTKWKTMTSASPNFTVHVRQDVPHFSHIFWLFVGVMILPAAVMVHHISFSMRRWKDSDYSPWQTE